MPISAEKLRDLIRHNEKPKVDFKKEYRLEPEAQKEEFAKDISAIANTPGGIGYLLIGISDKKKIVGIDSDSFKEEQMQQLITSRVEPPVVFSPYIVKLDQKNIGVIEIPSSLKRPHQIRRTGVFYIRRGTTTALMSVQEIISVLKRRADQERQHMSEYEQYPAPKRRDKITNDIIQSFIESGFAHTEKIVRFHYGQNQYTVNANILTNDKIKQRFHLIVISGKIDKYDMWRLIPRIEFWWHSLPESKFLNIGLIFSDSNISTTTLVNDFSRKFLTMKKINSKNAYFGIGDIVKPSKKEIRAWYNIEAAIPKFLLMKIKSKEDIKERIALIEDFIDEHKSLFKIALKLKSYYQINKRI